METEFGEETRERSHVDHCSSPLDHHTPVTGLNAILDVCIKKHCQSEIYKKSTASRRYIKKRRHDISICIYPHFPCGKINLEH